MDRRDFLRKAGLSAATVLTQGAVFGAEDNKELRKMLEDWRAGGWCTTDDAKS